ncbi:glycosyltransferase family 4 protein [Salinirubellus salinus]|uniref:Glycosyltransferase family 4 protein n=1 Tax=Salinirubellus salinus TaxID=1364945 RepID=A0A9E7R3A2_9EURY|nr:glycosyltransferase family 4 protein [Salinirubellus salinus]UWM54772.1 glycosyltransferase family 4 protein [Salinirubellus salinus]
MQVGVVARFTDPYVDRDGVARTEAVARALAARGHDVTVYCTGWWAGYDETREHDGVTYRAVTISPTRPSFLARIPALLAADRPDVVHATPDPPAAVLSARLGASIARAPLVVDWYGDEPLDRYRERAARVPDRVVAPSQLVRREVRELGATEEATTVVPESVEMDLVRSVDPAGEADIVAARRLDEGANLESFLLALAEYRQRGWQATVVGDGPEREAYEEQAADLRIGDRVEFVGSCSREERIARYRAAHVFVHTARREEFATELCWALACGCVGIVEYQAASAAHELVERRERGFRATSPEEITDALEAASEYGRLTVDESMDEYDTDAVTDRWLSVYRDAGATVYPRPASE